MPVFRKKGEEIYLITNYKVMYSTLYNTDLVQLNLNYTKVKRNFMCKIVLSQFHLRSAQFYLLTRNPYDKLESFFRDKLREDVIRKNANAQPWQDCQKCFFDLLGLTSLTPRAQVAKALMSVSFFEFVSMLTEIYKKDTHMTPQFWSMFVHSDPRARIRLPIPLKNIYRMESSTDLHKIERLFSICLKDRRNTTDRVKFQIEWSAKERKIVNEIYAKDFDYFNYQKKFN